MKFYFASGSKRQEELTKFIETSSVYNSKHKVVLNREDAEVVVHEQLELTVAGNEFFRETILPENDTEDLIRDILAFFGPIKSVQKRTCKLICTMKFYDLRGKEILSEEESTEFFLMEEPWDKSYTGYDIDTILFKKEVNHTLSSMPQNMRFVYSPRCKAFKKLLDKLG